MRKAKQAKKRPEEPLSKADRKLVASWKQRIVDFDGDDKPISIEVLNPSKAFPKEILAILPPEFVRRKGK